MIYLIQFIAALHFICILSTDAIPSGPITSSNLFSRPLYSNFNIKGGAKAALEKKKGKKSSKKEKISKIVHSQSSSEDEEREEETTVEENYIEKTAKKFSAEELSEAILKKADSKDSLVCEESPLDDRDGGSRVVFISKQKMEEFGLSEDEAVIVKGKKRRDTVAIVRVDEKLGPNLIRISREMRLNLQIHLGDITSITRMKEIKVAKSIQVAPYAEDIKNLKGDLFEVFVKPYFLGKQLPVKLGDSFSASGSMTNVEFQVTEISLDDEESDEDDKATENGAKYCIVGPETEVLIAEGDGLSREFDSRLNQIGYDDIGGCRKQLAAIRELVELPLRHPEVFNSIGIPPPRGVLLYGPSGTGKTSLAKAVAAETGAYFYVLNGPEIMSKQSGESEGNLRKAFEEAEKNAPAIIFIDEIDSIAPKRDKAGGETERRIVSQLLTLFDGIKRSANVVVIAATNRPNVLDPALRRFGRFDRELSLAQPEEDGRLEILKIKTRDMKLAPNCDLRAVSRDTHGYVGADLAQVCMEAAFRAIREVIHLIDLDADTIDADILDSIQINDEHFRHAVSVTHPSSLRENIVEVPDTTWADIGGLEDVKQELRELVQLPVEYSHLYKKFGTSSSKGVLFYGPPGCGKTLLAKAIANEAGANFISVKGPELLNAHIGESEANVRTLFDKARAAAPCILFFDEMDSIAKARGKGGGGSGLGDNVINQILTEIDGVEDRKSVFIIGATNRPDILDPAVMRPGHLDQLVYIPLPDYESRLSIFRANLRKCPVDPAVDVNKLAAATEGFSGADITEICQRAAKNAIREDIAADVARANRELAISEGKQLDPLKPEDEAKLRAVDCIRKDHFEEAMSRARRSVSDKDIEQYKQFIKKQKSDAKDAGEFSFEGKEGSESSGDDKALQEEGDDDNLYG